MALYPDQITKREFALEERYYNGENVWSLSVYVVYIDADGEETGSQYGPADILMSLADAQIYHDHLVKFGWTANTMRPVGSIALVEYQKTKAAMFGILAKEVPNGGQGA